VSALADELAVGLRLRSFGSFRASQDDNSP
jgi:hypothetical protein